MTETAQSPRIAYTGIAAGTLGPFDLETDGTSWTFSADSEIVVIRYSDVDATTGVTLVLNSDYTISGGSGAGQVTLGGSQTGLLDTERLVIYRDTPLSQDLDTTASTRLSAASIESAHDKTVRQLQDLRAQMQWLLDAAGGGFNPAFSTSSTSSSSSSGGITLPSGEGFVFQDNAGAISLQTGTGTPGSSAYEIWINDGNVGTEADFLASLVGQTGATGATGAAGSNGANGTDGTNGTDGLSAYQIWLNEGNVGTEADFLDDLRGTGLASGANYRENPDGTYTMWGVALIVSGGVPVTVTLPVAVANTNYRINFGSNTLTPIAHASKTTTNFEVSAGVAAGVDWQVEGATV